MYDIITLGVLICMLACLAFSVYAKSKNMDYRYPMLWAIFLLMLLMYTHQVTGKV